MGKLTDKQKSLVEALLLFILFFYNAAAVDFKATVGIAVLADYLGQELPFSFLHDSSAERLRGVAREHFNSFLHDDRTDASFSVGKIGGGTGNFDSALYRFAENIAVFRLERGNKTREGAYDVIFELVGYHPKRKTISCKDDQINVHIPHFVGNGHGVIGNVGEQFRVYHKGIHPRGCRTL